MDYGTVMKSQWKLDFMEISKDDLSRGYRANGKVVECGLYECNYAQSVIEWLKPHGWQPEIDDNRSIVSVDVIWHDMDHDKIWNYDQRCMRRAQSQVMDDRRLNSINLCFYIDKLRLSEIWYSRGFTPQSTVPSNTQSTIHRSQSVNQYAQVPRQDMFSNKNPSYSYNADTAQGVLD
jgi:hypothetical protein